MLEGEEGGAKVPWLIKGFLDCNWGMKEVMSTVIWHRCITCR